MYFKHDMMFFQKKTVVFAKKTRQKTYVSYVEKAKQKVYLENCKCFFKKERNTVILRAYFFWRGSPLPPGYGPGFISVNFDNIAD